jgi:hypothetical protein
MNGVEAYPLHWPPHRKRTQYRRRAAFHSQKRETHQRTDGSTYSSTSKQSLSVADSRDRLFHELKLLGASKVVISSNLKLKIDGTPLGNQSNPVDPGVAVYFHITKLPHCLSCDAWDRAADNLAAIAKYVEAMRGQIRWGVADVASMFAGFKALPGAVITPASMSVDDAARFVATWAGVTTGTVLDKSCFSDSYRDAARKLHPDANGGVERQEWHTLQEAKQAIDHYHAGGGQ